MARLRLACVALGLTLLAFTQSSGQEAADTKLDLAVDPGGFLARSLHMWDPTAAAGHLPDQAYGYLFPMGPFFLLGKWSALAPWVVQRGWESLLLVAGFLGVVRLSRLLGVPGFWPRVAAGLTYALAPRSLMELGVISSELLPVAVLPWVLIPLVRGAETGSPRRAAAWSGFALLFAGGINASATAAILPVPALWLLTRRRGPRRRSLIGWWLLAVALACLWWAVPLLLLGRYSVPFLDWIESSAVTTSVTSFVNGLRGVDHWQAFLGPSAWPAGWILAVAPAAIVATTAIAALGVGGIARRDTPYRFFLTSVLVTGLVLLTLGHVASVGPPFAASVRSLLDGALNVFRNVHKFDPVVRLPIALGLGHALAALYRRLPERSALRLRRRPVVLHGRTLVALAVVGLAAVAITPALVGRIVPQTRAINDPTWWKQTATWLHRNGGDGRALVVPGAAQPVYVWGSPRDDALQPYAASPWTVRDATPFAQPGYIRLLDRIEATLGAGQADPVLAPLLARAGIRYLVVRNDLDTASSQATPLPFVHATISASPGFTLAASFGPRLGAAPDPNRLVDLGLGGPNRPVQVYANTAWHQPVSLQPVSGTVRANGSTDELPALIGAGLPASTPVVFGSGTNDGLGSASPRRVLTDGIRRREFGFGGVDLYSATMTADQPFTVPRAAHDYLPANADPLSTARYTGIADVRVSSAASAGQSGWAALDDLPGTAWVSRSLHGAVGQWLQVDLPSRTSIPALQIAFAANRKNYPTRLRVATAAGVVVDDVTPDSNTQPLPLPAGGTTWVRITVQEVARRLPEPVAVASLAIPGLLPSRSLDVPGAADPDLVSFAVVPGHRAACLTVQGGAACEPSWAAAGEEDDALDRTFALQRAAPFSVQVGLQPQPGPQLDNLLDAGNPVRALASSTDSQDPRERAGAAVDGNPRTGWVAKAGDRLPSLELSTSRRYAVDGVQLRPVVGAPVAAPQQVVITAGHLTVQAVVPPDGRIMFPRSATTRTVRITVTTSSLRVDTDSATGKRRLLPVGIGEVRLLGSGVPAPRTRSVVRVRCGRGPSLFANGAEVPLELAAPATEVLAGAAVSARTCGRSELVLPGGSNRLHVSTTELLRPVSMVLRHSGATLSSPAGTGTVRVRDWAATSRDVAVSTPVAAYLSVPENANPGWSATLRGRTLTSVVLDGWHQGWVLPAGAHGVVHLEFTPQRTADWGLALGALAVLVLLVGAAWPGRRVAWPAPTGSAVLGRWSARAAAAVGMGLLGGVTGLALLAVVAVARSQGGRFGGWVAARSTGRWWLGAPGLAAAALLVAGLAEAIGPADSGRALADNGGVQTLCLFAVAVLVGTLLPAAAPRPAEAAKQRPLEQVERQGGDNGGRQGGEHEQLQEVAAEHGPVHPVLNEDQ